MQHFSTLVFDLDGTLTDPALGVVRCMNYALTSFDYSPLPDHQISKHIGPPLEDTLTLLTGSDDRAHIEALAAAYRERYGEFGYKENTVYDGVVDMLQTLQRAGMRMIVCTSKLEINAIRVLREFQLLDYFELVNGALEPGPKSQQLASLISKGIIDQDALMIGDRHVDLRAANANGLSAAGVLWGYGSVQELQEESPALLFGSPQELAERLG